MTDEYKEHARAAAQAVAQNAWCSYSQFPVGAAIVTTDGEIISGCNVENASSGLTICAERNAIASAVAAGHREFKFLAVYTPTPTPTAPCGACRQVIAEFCQTLEIESICDGESSLATTLEELLPHRFDSNSLT